MYLLLTTFTALFTETYGWGTSDSGWVSSSQPLSQPKALTKFIRILSAKAKNNGIGKPEYRMPIMFGGSVLIPVGLLWYGWSADRHTHWIVPVLGSSVFGFGVMLCFLPVQVYVVDCFKYAASASAAAAMFVAMGVGGGYSLLAGLALVLEVKNYGPRVTLPDERRPKRRNEAAIGGGGGGG
ncbi:hypothetical protein FRC02_009392 [Tulasnella sp. 418]|nr:hypothetical protein FRC02_009392 [Tulasnella sp. 418]